MTKFGDYRPGLVLPSKPRQAQSVTARNDRTVFGKGTLATPTLERLHVAFDGFAWSRSVPRGKLVVGPNDVRPPSRPMASELGRPPLDTRTKEHRDESMRTGDKSDPELLRPRRLTFTPSPPGFWKEAKPH